MPAKKTTTGSGGFTAEERAAMKERVRELKTAKRGADGEKDVLAAIAKTQDSERKLCEKLHKVIRDAAPHLLPKTWYGMPAYANEAGKAVIFFQDSGKFGYRYSTLGFQDIAHLDDGDIWPVSYALQKWTPKVEKKVIELVKTAIS